VLALPGLGCGLAWLIYLYPITDSLRTILSRSRLYKFQLNQSLWDMVMDHPAGIGVGEEAFAVVYPAYAAPDLGAVTDSGNLFFEILLSYGWPGLILFAALLFFFLQKGLTCLGHTAVTQDRAMILGGMASLLGVVIFGSVRSFITSPRVFFTILLMIALCSAYENIIFDEYDVTRASWESTPCEDSRLFRRR
jgi:O-antigen ligase